MVQAGSPVFIPCATCLEWGGVDYLTPGGAPCFDGRAGRARVLPPRPDYAAIAAAAGFGAIAYLVSGDASMAVAAALVAGLLAFPIAFVAREVVVLANYSVDQRSAENVYEWLKSVAALAGIANLSVAYTSRSGVNGVQVVGMGLASQRVGSSIASLLHRAAWHAAPVAKVLSAKEAIVVVPGYVMTRLGEVIVNDGGKRRFIVGSIDDLKLAYKTVRAILRELVGSRVLAAYMSVKLINKMLVEGLILVIPVPELLERAEKSLPFENPLIKLIVKRQLALEMRLSLA